MGSDFWGGRGKTFLCVYHWLDFHFETRDGAVPWSLVSEPIFQRGLEMIHSQGSAGRCGP